MSWEEVRAGFPVLERFAYLNAGTMGPLARATHDAMVEQQRRELERGRFGAPFFERLNELRSAARERLGALIGVPADQVSLTSSTTDGCNIVVAGLELGRDDEIVTTDAEHFGLLGPLGASAARVRVAAVQGRPAGEAIDAILGEVTPRTRLLALSHVLWTSGNIVPVDDLKEATGLPVLVDGAQAAGAIEVDASGLDFYTVSAQKWPCGPDGTGALYVADPERLRVSAPSYFAQASYEPDGSFVAREGAARFDPGWLPMPLLAGLVAALGARPDGWAARAADLAARCRERLAEHFDVMTEPGQATLVSWRADGPAPDAVKRAWEAGVVIRSLPGDELLRASCGYWTNESDIDRLVSALTR
jgi:selenocysteine lyase/cysteine desulfurase